MTTPTTQREADELNEIFAAIDEAQRLNRYNESSFSMGSAVARLKCLADAFRALRQATPEAPATVCSPDCFWGNCPPCVEAGIAWATCSAATDQPSAGRADERAELIDLLKAIRPSYGAVGSRDVDVAAQQKRIDRAVELLSARASLTPTAPAERRDTLNEVFAAVSKATATELVRGPYLDSRNDALNAIRALHTAPQAATTASASGPKCECCDGKGGWATAEWTDPISGPECESEICTDCNGTGFEAKQPDIMVAALRGAEQILVQLLDQGHSVQVELREVRAALARAPLPAQAPTDDEIERAALKHVATGWKQLTAVSNLDPDYRKGEQFKRLKAFALELFEGRGQAVDVARDAARLDWIDKRIADKGSVWILPSGAEMQFVQLRHAGHTTNYPTVPGKVREAIDAAMSRTNTTGGSDD